MLLFTCLFHSLTVCPCCKRRWEVWIQRRKKEREKISANVHIHFCFPWHRFHCKRISQYNCIAYNVTWYHVPVFKTTICNICYLNGKFTWKMAMQLNGMRYYEHLNSQSIRTCSDSSASVCAFSFTSVPVLFAHCIHDICNIVHARTHSHTISLWSQSMRCN